MNLSDSMFLFEIVLEDLRSYVNYDDFSIFTQFANLFSLNLKNPADLEVTTKRPRKKIKRKKVRENKEQLEKIAAAPKVKVGQSVLIPSNVHSLMINMRTNPLQLRFCPKNDPEYTLGSTSIPWGHAFFVYLHDIIKKHTVPPAIVEGMYNVYDEMSSKRMATVKMSVKLTCLTDKITTQFRSLSEDDSHTFIYTGFNSEPITILSTIKEKDRQDRKLSEETGTIKTIYSGGKKFKNSHKDKDKSSEITTKLLDTDAEMMQPKKELKAKINLNRYTEIDDDNELRNTKESINEKIVDLVKSDTNLEVNKQIAVVKSKSCSSLEYQSHLNTLDYIFGDRSSPYGGQVYCVGYFTVQNDHPSKETVKSLKSSDHSMKTSESSRPNSVKSLTGLQKSSENLQTEPKPKEKYKFKICDDECPGKSTTGSCSVDLPEDAAPLVTIKKCTHVTCDTKKHREPPSPPDTSILVDLSSLKTDCCVKTKEEQVVGGMTAKLKIGDKHPCYCSCECRFGFTKKTTYCNVCGGYELVGEELARRPGHDMPFPCPIFHKLVDKSKRKSLSATGSDSRRNLKKSGGDSEKDSKKGKKTKKDDRFKFNYGYQGIPPQIGHSQCAMPCTGTLSNVPKSMGWLWTAENVPGLKFRPNWRPGATSKHVVRLLRIAKNPGEVKSKKRRKDTGKKRPLKRPLLIVHKKDGEYEVTMETMRTYNKPRAINQHPYEDKPVVTYTIGRSEEENRERRKKKERVKRRLEKAQRDFIQSAFRDMCQDICMKTYRQALGILPDAEDPECTCYPAEPGPDRTNLDVSCSCSEDSASLGSETDSDEWVVEFTPPNALFDPTYKGKKVIKVDNSSQYTYLDYRVKLVDRYGNPVPRFFRGLDGKQQCSDLGGFWGPDHKWQEINVDGFIAPDNRWAPMSFFGPNGEQIEAEGGKFQAANGKWLVVGVDGYIDSQLKWRFYPRPRNVPTSKKSGSAKKTDQNKKDDKNKKPVEKPSEATWSCFGDASPKDLGKMGIMGHGVDRKLLLSTLNKMLARGEDVTIPQPSMIPRRPGSKKNRKPRSQKSVNTWNYEEQSKCRHPVPSEKGILAVDGRGNKTYFRLKNFKNTRPKDRLTHLTEQGISLSSFHVPCFHSFINSEVMRQEQRARLDALTAHARSVGTQAHLRILKLINLTVPATSINIKVAKGWRPGAISKRLLSKLNKAKLMRSTEEGSKSPLKKTKKRVDNKPTLIICKVNGEYIVEMQVTGEGEGAAEQYSPLVYRIAKANNEEKIAQLERKKRRLVGEAVGAAWEDPYHPEVCERTCLTAYKQAVGLLPLDPNRPGCVCPSPQPEPEPASSSEDISSVGSSMDLDWEIHFTPPCAYYNSEAR